MSEDECGLALRLDDDIQVVHEDLQQVRDELRTVEDTLTEHGGRFDSIDAELRSLTTMVGEVLNRPPGSSDDDEVS